MKAFSIKYFKTLSSFDNREYYNIIAYMSCVLYWCFIRSLAEFFYKKISAT